jgi:hypothetical protein
VRSWHSFIFDRVIYSINKKKACACAGLGKRAGVLVGFEVSVIGEKAESDNSPHCENNDDCEGVVEDITGTPDFVEEKPSSA